MKTFFENTDGDYTLQGDYPLPNLTFPDKTEKQSDGGKMRCRQYLKSNDRVFYYNLPTSCKLDDYLAEVE